MTLYVLSLGGYEGDFPVSIHLTSDLAKAASPGEWQQWGQTDMWGRDYTSAEMGDGEIRHALINPIEVCEQGMNGLQLFALAILKGDPIALDAARDVLKQ